MRDSKGRFVRGNQIGSECRFKKGHKMKPETIAKMKKRIPWNKGKGKSISKNLGIFIDLSTFPKDKRRKGYIDDKGYRRIKIKGKVIKEHRYQWEQHYGNIPKNFDVHHIDGNKLNNDINNLEVIGHGKHSRKSIENIRN